MKKRKKLSFLIVAYTILILMIGTNIPSPLYGLYREEWGFSPFILTLIFATYALVLIPSLALFGRLSDRYGRKRVIWLGVIVSVLGSLTFIFAKGMAWLFVARAFQGLSIGILSGAATAALMELAPSENKKLAPLTASIVTAGGTALGPLLSGLIAQYVNHPILMPLISHLILIIPCFIGLVRMVETVNHSAEQTLVLKDTPNKRDFWKKEQKQPFVASAITAFISWAVTALFMSIMPSYVSNLLHVHNLALLSGFVFLMLGTSVMTQFLPKKLTFSLAMKSGITLLTIGLVCLVIAVPLQSLLFLLIGTLITGVGQGLSFKGSMELVNVIAPANQKGAIVSRFYVIIYLGVGLPIIGIGFYPFSLACSPPFSSSHV